MGSEPVKARINQFTSERSARGSAASSIMLKKPDRVDHPATSERVLTDGEREFVMAARAYQERTGRKFPTHSELFRVFVELGYVKP